MGGNQVKKHLMSFSLFCKLNKYIYICRQYIYIHVDNIYIYICRQYRYIYIQYIYIYLYIYIIIYYYISYQLSPLHRNVILVSHTILAMSQASESVSKNRISFRVASENPACGIIASTFVVWMQAVKFMITLW